MSITSLNQTYCQRCKSPVLANEFFCDYCRVTMGRLDYSTYHRCPRCGARALPTMTTCQICALEFQRDEFGLAILPIHRDFTPLVKFFSALSALGAVACILAGFAHGTLSLLFLAVFLSFLSKASLPDVVGIATTWGSIAALLLGLGWPIFAVLLAPFGVDPGLFSGTPGDASCAPTGG